MFISLFVMAALGTIDNRTTTQDRTIAGMVSEAVRPARRLAEASQANHCCALDPFLLISPPNSFACFHTRSLKINSFVCKFQALMEMRLPAFPSISLPKSHPPFSFQPFEFLTVTYFSSIWVGDLLPVSLSGLESKWVGRK